MTVRVKMALTRILAAARPLFSCLFVIVFVLNGYAQQPPVAPRPSVSSVPRNILLRIVRAEDERRWDADLGSLLSDSNPFVRKRAALAAGRIGDDRAAPTLITLLQEDRDDGVRAMAAFALGETESPAAGDALVAELAKTDPANARARVVEALGKITAALSPAEEARLRAWRAVIRSVLEVETQHLSRPDPQLILLSLTAALRARPESAGKLIAEFLSHSEPRVRADAANALARLRAKEGNEQLRRLLVGDPDPIVRANAARVLGATEEKAAFDALLEGALSDKDSGVRVSAIRALSALKDARALDPLVRRSKKILAAAGSDESPVRKGKQRLRSAPGSGTLPTNTPAETNELLEIATALGGIAENTRSQAVYDLLDAARAAVGQGAPELEIAKARIAPQLYSIDLQLTPAVNALVSASNWRVWSAMAQGATALASVKADSPLLDGSIKNETIRNLSNLISCPQDSAPIKSPRVEARATTVVGVRCTPIALLALPEWLRAFAAFKQPGTDEIMRKHLTERDVVVRATAGELLGELPPDDRNTRALVDALPVALGDKESNDATLAILEALGKQKSQAANDAIKSALDSPDHLIRRRAVALLRANGAGDFSARIGTVQTRNKLVVYRRAISRIGTSVRAIVSTTKGSFTIELLPDDAPITVDNFVQLAKRDYFRGVTIHRVVPNFVVQDGDPRGDGNGSPGYQIRCEINQVPFKRGAVGMALSGKDTGGSQWFVTHSPQPHLDGGFTVFGRVVSGMEVVDGITRGDVIRDIVITENQRRASRRGN